jgi:hypothetical protein
MTRARVLPLSCVTPTILGLKTKTSEPAAASGRAFVARGVPDQRGEPGSVNFQDDGREPPSLGRYAWMPSCLKTTPGAGLV